MIKQTNKEHELKNLRCVRERLPKCAMPTNQAAPLFEAIALCYYAGCTNEEIDEAMYGQRCTTDGDI